ncbi:MAG: PDZ domain-containing protein, partial [Zoogloeaceae bacterium]|nr:PDZ domain-containing protein [Zoogloeaceae bacterium]
MSGSIAYTLVPRFPEAHLFEVTCRVDAPDPAGQAFSMPVWIPGSYLVREFARHIVRLDAESEGRPVMVEKLDKATWKAAPCRGSLTLRYQVYAWDLSVRGAHLDTTHAFFNGVCVFLRPCGKAHLPCRVKLFPPPGAACRDWRVATALRRDTAPPWGFGAYRADDYEDLIEHPVEMGRFTRLDFEACGIAHHAVVTGCAEIDTERLRHDLAAICSWQMALFDSPLPDPYLFQIMAVGSGYGGLEHRNACALLCERTDLPAPGLAGDVRTENYVRFLGLASHEYFHRWNVRRLRPAAFQHQEGRTEAYTRLLWFFEGVTSYYDDLCLKRAGLIDETTYLNLLAKTITQVRKTPGRAMQSLAESSFDAWIKYYRPDENTPNVVVSYYTKGALVALCLDLALRHAHPSLSLDALMRALWRMYGVSGQGLSEIAVFEAIAELGTALDEVVSRKTRRLSHWLREMVEGTDDPPLARHLAQFGVRLTWKNDNDLPWLGMRLTSEGEAARIRHVRTASPAEAAGLAAGDEIVALREWRVTRDNWEHALASLRAGEKV